MKLKLMTSFLAVVLLLAGCMGTDTNEEGRGMKDNTNLENTKYQDGTNQGGGLTDNVNNRNNMDSNARDNKDNNARDNKGNKDRNKDDYDISSEAADKIVSEINEIESAYVLTSNNQAYVAARLDEKASKGTKGNQSKTETSDKTSSGDMNDKEDKNKAGNAAGNDLDNTDMTRNGDMGEGEDVTDEVKEKIAKIVQSTNPNIKNVYVTTSPDFIELVNNYSDDMDNGKPIRGFFDQAGNMIERLFPQNKR